MNFFRIFNVIYKLFTSRGRKAIIITFIIIALLFVFTGNVHAAVSGDSSEFDQSYINFHYINIGWAANANEYDYAYSDGSFRFLRVPYVSVGRGSLNYNSNSNSETFALCLNPNYVYNLYIRSTLGLNFAFIKSFSDLPNGTLTSFDYPTLKPNTDQFMFLGSDNWLIFTVSSSSDLNNYRFGISDKPIQNIFGSSSGGSSSGSSADYSSVLNNIYTDLHSLLLAVQNSSNTDVVNAVTNTSEQTQNIISTTSAETQNTISSTSAETQNLITNQTQQSQAQYNDFTNTTMNDNDIDLPTENNQDITSSGFDSIFTSMYNVFTTDNAPDIVLPIPYANENITISPSVISSMIGNNVIVSFIQAWYWFIVAYYIYKDVQKVIEKIKDGSIASSSDTNIKTEML